MISQRDAGYVDHPVGSERCDGCVMFRLPHSCTLVRGYIIPNGHCRHWYPAKKAAVKLFADFVKAEPGPAAVHVPAALGGSRPLPGTPHRMKHQMFAALTREPTPRLARTPKTSGPTPVTTSTSKRGRTFDEMITGVPRKPRGFLEIVSPATATTTAKRYATTADLPKPVRDRFKGRPKKLRQFMHVWNGEYNSHGDEGRAFATAWAAVKKNLIPPMTGAEGRTLHPLNDHAYHVPFAYDPHFWGSLTAEDEPRFLGAITHPKDLPKAKVPLNSLRAIQNRVNSDDIERHVADPSKKRPVIVKFRGNHYIGDGHDRLTARWLRGKKSAKVRLFDLDNADTSPQNKREVDKQFKVQITKFDQDKRQVFGWASVCTKNGEYICDKQDDIIPVESLEEAVYDYILSSRDGADMHTVKGASRCIESMVFTKEKQKALGIDLGQEGWWVGYLVDSPDLWSAVKRGERPEFSIGGAAVPVSHDKYFG